MITLKNHKEVCSFEYKDFEKPVSKTLIDKDGRYSISIKSLTTEHPILAQILILDNIGDKEPEVLSETIYWMIHPSQQMKATENWPFSVTHYFAGKDITSEDRPKGLHFHQDIFKHVFDIETVKYLDKRQ
jgi:hypothetical protein